MTNRREHKRVPITGIATLKFENKGKIQSIQALPGSISLGGIGLYSDDPIEIDTNVLLTINFISIDGVKNDSIEGHVIHYKNIGGTYFMGIQFNEEINSKNQPSLYEYLQKILTWDK